MFGVIKERVEALMPTFSPVYKLYVTQRLNNQIRRMNRTITDMHIGWYPDFPTGYDEYIYREVEISGKIMYLRITVDPVKRPKKTARATKPVTGGNSVCS